MLIINKNYPICLLKKELLSISAIFIVSTYFAINVTIYANDNSDKLKDIINYKIIDIVNYVQDIK